MISDPSYPSKSFFSSLISAGPVEGVPEKSQRWYLKIFLWFLVTCRTVSNKKMCTAFISTEINKLVLLIISMKNKKGSVQSYHFRRIRSLTTHFWWGKKLDIFFPHISENKLLYQLDLEVVYSSGRMNDHFMMFFWACFAPGHLFAHIRH